MTEKEAISPTKATKVPHVREFVPAMSKSTWLILGLILIVYAIGIALLHPTNFFGMMEDDSLYFSSAREIAQGHGYVMPNVPGAPAATKYPVLYPWMLSWIWRLRPHFPENLSWAVALNVAFGALFLTTTFLLLRKLQGVGDMAALAITAFCAVHPVMRILSSYIMSDVPFAALTMLACLLASHVLERKNGFGVTLFCGAVCGTAFLLRSLGAPVAAGIGLFLLLRAGSQKAAWFAAAGAPFAGISIVRSLLIKPAAATSLSGGCAHAWKMTWLYYTSYTGYWKADILGNHVFWRTLQSDSTVTLLQPGSYFLTTTVIRPPVLALVLLVLLSAITIRGFFRQIQTGGVQPIHFALAFYLLPLLVWDYANAERFLLPFLSLFAAGLFYELRYFYSQWRAPNAKGKEKNPRATPLAFLCVAAVLVFVGACSLARFSAAVSAMSQTRAEALVGKRQAYEWLRKNTKADARVIAYEDASEFLYAERHSLRPMIFSPAGASRPAILDRELQCIGSSADAIEANYWLVSEDDFGAEWGEVIKRGMAAEEKMESSLQPVFRSTDRAVRVYKLDYRASY